MKVISILLSLTLTALLLQACASSNNTPMAAQPYNHPATPSNDYMYRSPPPDVAQSLSGR